MPSIEGNIQTVLKVEAEAVSIPGANLALLIGGGQRARRQRRITQVAAGLVSAAVTVAVAGVVISASGGVGGESAPAANPTGSGVSTGQPASDPLGGLETGGRPDAAYVTQGQLHVGEGVRDVRRNELFSVIWDPDEASLKEITGLEGYQGLSAVIPAGPVFVDRTDTSGPATSTYGLVDEHGRFEPVGRVPTRSGSWSPSGDIVAYTTSSTRAVTKPIADEAVPLHTPSSMRIGQMMWESSRAVLVVVLDEQGHATWLRCDAGTGGCVIAADLGDDTRYSTDWQVARN